MTRQKKTYSTLKDLKELKGKKIAIYLDAMHPYKPSGRLSDVLAPQTAEEIGLLREASGELISVKSGIKIQILG